MGQLAIRNWMNCLEVLQNWKNVGLDWIVKWLRIFLLHVCVHMISSVSHDTLLISCDFGLGEYTVTQLLNQYWRLDPLY